MGQVVRGRNATYHLPDALRAPTVFEAQLLHSVAVRFRVVSYGCNIQHISLSVSSVLVKTALGRER